MLKAIQLRLEALKARRTKTVVSFLICAFVLCLAWSGYVVYRIERHRMHLRNGRQALERADVRSALSFARRAVEDGQNDINACRLMADVQDAIDSSAVLTWRLRAAQLEPSNVSNYLAWAETALKLGNAGAALKALNSAPAERTGRADWQNLMGKTETALNQFPEAESRFNEAVRLQPGDPTYQIDLYSIRLQSADRSMAADAQRRLEQLAGGEPAGILALRALLREALNSNDLERARSYGAEIEERQDANFNDSLLALEARSRGGQANEALDKLKERAVKEPRNAVSLAYWLMGHGRADDAARWLEERFQLPSAPVSLQTAHADALIAQGKWSEIESKLRDERWSESDYLRLAAIARSLRERQETGFAKAWDQAVKSSRRDQISGFRLGVLVLSWGWKGESTDLFWRVVETAPQWRSQALWILWQISRADRNAPGLLRVASNQHEDDPKDIRYKNNYSFYLLLLNIDIQRAVELAQECWRQAPSQPNVAATYAFALYRVNKYQEGVQVLDKLPAKDLDEPNIALYYALVLSAAGQTDKASHYLALARKSDRFLPQELELADRLAANLTATK
jgi:predicted Zn-dependent protease